LSRPNDTGHVDAQVAGQLDLRVLEHQLRLLDLCQRLAAAVEERGAIFRQADASCGSGEKPRADLVLQPVDGVADTGLGDA
jgi:hypothetical protein